MEQNYQQQIDTLLDIVYQNGASDLHLSVGRHPFLRVNGALNEVQNYPVLTADDMIGIVTVLAGEEKATQLVNMEEVDFAYNYGEKLRLRGNAYVQSNKITIALRTIQKIKTLAELKLPDTLLQFVRAKQGFFLVVGPVGVGKSTTLAALIDVINSERREHIVTIEHPIEYIHQEKQSIIDQREVGLDTHSFHTALESAFREDVNVILVGEMQTPDTIATAVTAAETGHLVLSTLHTNSAAQTVDRIIDSFPPEQEDQVRLQLSASLLGIFSQRLIPSLKGGLVPAYELLINTPAVSNIIREKRTQELDTMIETGSEHGMISMNRSLIELVRAGEISFDDAKTYSTNPNGLEGMMQ
jgi:twitching motility protein PilT